VTVKITLIFLKLDCNHSINVSGIETACRSINNLLQRLHHSYWFYFMPSAYAFIPIAKYIGQLIGVIVATILASVGLWWSSGELEASKQKNRKPWQFLQRSFGLASFSTKIRPLYMPLLSLGLSFLFPGYVFFYIDTIRFMANVDSFSVSVYIS
jgi:glycosylphosphatidylinositol transamidase